MIEKQKHIEAGSPGERQMRETLTALLFAECAVAVNHNVCRVIAKLRGQLFLACRDWAWHQAFEESQELREMPLSFDTLEQWIDHFVQLYSVDAIMQYVSSIFDEMEKGQTKEGQPIDADVHPEITMAPWLGGEVEEIDTRGTIPANMKIRMLMEIKETIEGLSSGTLVSTERFTSLLRKKLEDAVEIMTPSRSEYIEDETCPGLEKFNPDPDVRMSHDSLADWLAYYLQAYKFEAILEALVEFKDVNIDTHLYSFIFDRCMLNNGQWKMVVDTYPGLEGHREEFAEQLAQEILKELESSVFGYLYAKPYKQGFRIKIEKTHAKSLKIKLLNSEMQYTLTFEGYHGGVRGRCIVQEKINIATIAAKIGVPPEGLEVLSPEALINAALIEQERKNK